MHAEEGGLVAVMEPGGGGDCEAAPVARCRPRYRNRAPLKLFRTTVLSRNFSNDTLSDHLYRRDATMPKGTTKKRTSRMNRYPATVIPFTLVTAFTRSSDGAREGDTQITYGKIVGKADDILK